ncbi:MAG TPA: hypothetical protein VNF71_14980, partial [Acidimicrobiales bacterium]|nr:hypothetical protein [Acidimicrobiales bacterium]
MKASHLHRVERIEALVRKANPPPPTDDELVQSLRDCTAGPNAIARLFDIIEPDFADMMVYWGYSVRFYRQRCDRDDLPSPIDLLSHIIATPPGLEVPPFLLQRRRDNDAYRPDDWAKWRDLRPRFAFVFWARTRLGWLLTSDPEALSMRIQVDNWFERDEEPANMGRTASARSIRLTEPLDKQLDRAIVLSNAVYELWA